MTKRHVWDQYDTAFKQVTAFAVLFDDQTLDFMTVPAHVANIVIKHPRDGAGRVVAFVHWLGREVVRGSAGGGGYDKTSAALHEAGRKLASKPKSDSEARPEAMAALGALLVDADNGQNWERTIGDAEGFTLLRVIQ